MEQLSELLRRLPERHRNALRWFIEHAGTVQPWPRPLPDGTILASKAKGICKPAWSRYALSVRQSLNSPYADREPILRQDGTWSYLYFQENPNPTERDTEFTNRSLVECLHDSVPIGVMRQAGTGEAHTYEVLGVAIVAGWEQGYFFLEGFSPQGTSRERSPQPLLDSIANTLSATDGTDGRSPVDMLDARRRIVASIVRRQGQHQFCQILISAYEGKCAVTGCDAEAALEACHIVPYLGEHTNNVSNGILLRADIHTLFDLGLISMDSGSMTIVLSPLLLRTYYRDLQGRLLRLPSDPSLSPAREAIATTESGLACRWPLRVQ